VKIDARGDRFEIRNKGLHFEIRDRRAESAEGLLVNSTPPVGRCNTRHEAELMIEEYLRTGHFELPSWYREREPNVRSVQRAWGGGRIFVRTSTAKVDAVRRERVRAECERLMARERRRAAEIVESMNSNRRCGLL